MFQSGLHDLVVGRDVQRQFAGTELGATLSCSDRGCWRRYRSGSLVACCLRSVPRASQSRPPCASFEALKRGRECRWRTGTAQPPFARAVTKLCGTNKYPYSCRLAPESSARWLLA
jgi:hypothetical protein